MGKDVTRNIGVNTRRLDHVMKKYVFDGKVPIGCLRFSSVFQRQLDANNIAEGAALMIWPTFLEGNARDVFDAHREDGEAGLGGFSTWPELCSGSFARTPKTSISRTNGCH